MLLAAMLAPAPGFAASPEAQAWIDGERLPGAQALAMGGAITALAEDWSASWHNPAALALLKRAETNLGFELGRAGETRSVSTDGVEEETRVSGSQLSHAGYAHPLPVLRGGLCWSAGWARLADFSQRSAFPDRDWRVSHSQDGQLDALLLSVAGQLGPNLAAGGTLALETGRLERVEREEDLVEGDLWRAHDRADLDGAALRLGLLAHQGRLRLGLLLEAPHSLEVNWSHLEETGSAGNLTPVVHGGASYALRMPTLLSLGAGWRARFWQAGLSWDWQDWSSLKYENLPDGAALDLSADVLSRALRPRSRLRAGGEWTLPGSDLRLRAGAWRESQARSSARLVEHDENGDPYDTWAYRTLAPRAGLAAGLSWLTQETVALDLGVSRESWEQRWLEFAQDSYSSEIRQRVIRWRAQLALVYRL
jgi:hypothetical protein